MQLIETIAAAKRINNGSGKPTVLEMYEIWSSVDGSLTITDGKVTYILYVRLGLNCGCLAIPFAPNADLVLTPSASMTVNIIYSQN